MVELGLEKRVFARVHTFGKALGAHGACVVGPAVLKTYLLNYARSLVYTTALPRHTLISIESSYDLLAQCATQKQSQLSGLISCWVEATKEFPPHSILNSHSSVQAVVIPGNQNVLDAAAILRKMGYHVLPIRSPTVPEGTERLRIIIHSHNTTQQVEGLANAVRKLVVAGETEKPKMQEGLQQQTQQQTHGSVKTMPKTAPSGKSGNSGVFMVGTTSSKL